LASFLSPANEQEPPPINSDWRRLSYGVFMQKMGKHEETEVWGPVVNSTLSGPLLDFDAGVTERQELFSKQMMGRATEIRRLVQPLAAGSSERQFLEQSLEDLQTFAKQQALWSHLVKARQRLMAPHPGLMVRPSEACMIIARTRRQTRADIKKFEREQRKRINDREEGRKRRLRSYLQRMMNHREDFMRYHRKRQQDTRGVASAVRKHWENRDKKL